MAPPSLPEYNPYELQTVEDANARASDPSPYFGNFQVDERDKKTPDEWIRRNPVLLRLTGRHPFNCEAPLEELIEKGWITPTDLHYVRNHGAVPKLEWAKHRLHVGGLVSSPQTFTMSDLAALPSATFPVLLVCAGNRRKEQNMTRQTIGFSWGPSGLSNSIWKGVLLRDLLLRCGAPDPLGIVEDGVIMPKWVIFQGAEDLPKGKYGTSIAYDVAMDPRCDLLVAYEQNGEPLAPDHGFPVRIVIPGHIGGRMVKWLARIIVSTEEDSSHYHFHDNRVLPPNVDAQIATAEGWWYKPEYIINELGINSVITSPTHDELVPITIDSGYKFRGYAYTGGGRAITRVEVSFNHGERWELAKQLPYPVEHIRRGKYWSWFWWELDVKDVRDLCGCTQVWVRAWEGQNTQPERLTWNVMGMMNNCYFRLHVHVEKTARGISLCFQQPAPVVGDGWMIKPPEDQQAAAKPIIKKDEIKELRVFSMSDVEKHSSEEDCWIVVNGSVYDCTKFLDDHPGGPESIVISAGTDCTEEFNAIHSSKAHDMLKDYLIGTIAKPPSAAIPASTKPVAPIEELVALNPRIYAPFKLIEKQKLSHDTRLFRFALPSPDHRLGLPPGKHMYISAQVNGKLVIRGYTPVSTDEEKGFFDLVVKIYLPNRHPSFPEGGVLTPWLDALPIGAEIKAKGPLGSIVYLGQGTFTLPKHKQPKSVQRISLIAGGTGITPCYQILRAVLSDQSTTAQNIRIWLLYACRTDRDILLLQEINELAEKWKGRVRVWYTLSGACPNGWMYGTGRVNKDMVAERCAPGGDGSLALACGPDGMVNGVMECLGEAGYAEDSRFAF
ncbi:hypothetical protein SpCBS45565_g06859 [Spizellomyces sp. 'palustris']|nr:hypothetical protein SpCBS45565_g06859 [Spizellomyces sp. 'palustris']